MTKICSECGSVIPETSKAGYCPKCLPKLADETEPSEMLASCEPRSGAAAPRLTLGDYELVEMLGEGGMGVVFKANQKKLNRTVALKMLKSGILATKGELKRFQTEAQAIARLQHPNIVRLHEVGEDSGRFYFSMDYVQGRTLSQIVGRTPLPPRRAAQYTKTIAEAVHHARTKGVLHRDLKPGNVIVNEQDQPQVTDFGLAKEIASQDPDVTGTGVVLGTPSYMSPEQAAGKRQEVSVPSDVYSIGAILYDLLTARPPFRADSASETIRQVIEKEPASVRLLNPNVPRDLETICHKCLTKDRERRYGSAQHIADDLERFLGGENIQARPAGRLERAYRWAMRHPSLAALVGAFATMFVLIGLIGRFSIHDAEDTAAVAPWVARGVAYEFKHFGEQVKAMAQDPRLVQMLHDGNPAWDNPSIQINTNSGINRFMSVLKAPEHGLADSKDHFENWLLINHVGDVLAILTKEENASALPNLAYREYFQEAVKFTNKVYFSRIYHSRSDERYKVAVAAAIRDRDGQLLGVVSKMVGPEEPIGLQSERTATAIIGELDVNGPSGRTNLPKYAVWWHRGLEKRPKEVVLIPDTDPIWTKLDEVGTLPFGEVTKVPGYKDPVGTAQRSYRGRWVAGMARIPETHLIEVYQVRDRLSQVKWAIGLCIGPLAVILGWRWFYNRRQMRRELASERRD